MPFYQKINDKYEINPTTALERYHTYIDNGIQYKDQGGIIVFTPKTTFSKYEGTYQKDSSSYRFYQNETSPFSKPQNITPAPRMSIPTIPITLSTPSSTPSITPFSTPSITPFSTPSITSLPFPTIRPTSLPTTLPPTLPTLPTLPETLPFYSDSTIDRSSFRVKPYETLPPPEKGRNVEALLNVDGGNGNDRQKLYVVAGVILLLYAVSSIFSE
jgi:hypothetical protein